MTKPGAKKGNPYKFNDKLKATFLVELERLGSYRAAAGAVNVSVGTVHRHRKSDEDFAESCENALHKLTEKLVSKARELALDGTVEKTFDREGRVIRERIRFDTKILLRMLSARDPENWSDTKKIESTISGKVEHEHKGAIKVEDLTTAQQRAARTLLQSDRNLN